MKYIVERLLTNAQRMDPEMGPGDALSILFTVLGNGIGLDTQGYIIKNYRCDENYEFPEPHPIKFIYPFSQQKEYMPFRQLRGCRDKGFKDAVRYFIECLKISDDSNKDIAEWKANIHELEKLLKAPLVKRSIKDKNDMDAFLEFIKDDKPTFKAPRDGTVLPSKNSVYKVWFFDVQWSDCPNLVQDEVRDIWKLNELGNDRYCYKCLLDDELFDRYPRTYMWLKHKGVQEYENVVIHWWW